MMWCNDVSQTHMEATSSFVVDPHFKERLEQPVDTLETSKHMAGAHFCDIIIVDALFLCVSLWDRVYMFFVTHLHRYDVGTSAGRTNQLLQLMSLDPLQYHS